MLLYSMSCDPLHDRHTVGGGPPFAAEFCRNPGREHMVAVADEEGIVTVLDSTRSTQSQAGEGRVDWRAHFNAIFDLAWLPGQDRLLTASGDQSCRLFDVHTQQEVRSFRGHKGSVKAITALDANLFASGARDGCVCLWDQRMQHERPVAQLQEVHAPAAGAAMKRRRSGQPTPSSVSSLLFLGDAAPGARLVSAGATDGAIKLWDVRQLATPSGAGSKGGSSSKAKASSSSSPPPSKGGAPQALVTLHPPCGSHGRQRGITSLSVDPNGTRLLAGATNSRVYMYDTRWASASSARHPTGGSSEEHVPSFEGHAVDSFYVKTGFSPDGKFVVSGSSDGGVYVWEADRPDLAPFTYWGHESEVTAVAWCPTNFHTLLSASDDTTVRVWRVDRERGPQLNQATWQPSGQPTERRPPAGVLPEQPPPSQAGPASETRDFPHAVVPLTPQTLPQPPPPPPAGHLDDLDIGLPPPPPDFLSPPPPGEPTPAAAAAEQPPTASNSAAGSSAVGASAAEHPPEDAATSRAAAPTAPPPRNTLRGWLLIAPRPDA